jgi:thioredoxin 2
MMAPAFQQAAAQLEPQVRLLKLNTEAHQQLAGQIGIRSIPTMVLFREGREQDRISGAMDAPSIVQWVRSRLA